MDDAQFAELAAWIVDAGLAGQSETSILAGFCERETARGLPLARGLVLIDTLHPIYEGRAFRWTRAKKETTLSEYGPAVNEVSRIASMCRSVDQPLLVSSAFAAAVGEARSRLVSVGRYALRGVSRPQDLFTLE
jgi:adenylate cyclase